MNFETIQLGWPVGHFIALFKPATPLKTCRESIRLDFSITKEVFDCREVVKIQGCGLRGGLVVGHWLNLASLATKDGFKLGRAPWSRFLDLNGIWRVGVWIDDLGFGAESSQSFAPFSGALLFLGDGP